MYARFSKKNQDAKARALQIEINRLQALLGRDEDAEAIVKRHILLLHRYNEAKDATQILIGRLASLKETTIRKVHQDFGLEDDD